ncbi:MAG TPA: 3'-5' exonuclease [Chthonomonadaceae bacterium]|nr:3'-5' exonuclease [Chthonomonadaceae bacterium]
METDKSQESFVSAALFGADPAAGLVAIELDETEGALAYRRTEAGVRAERMAFKPWILLLDRPEFVLPDAAYSELEGPGYNVLAEFDTVQAYRSARFQLQDRHVASVTYAGGAKMAFIRSGRTLFKGMTFDDVVRMQADIETEGLDAASHRVLLVAVSDNRGRLELIEGDEPEILRRFVALVDTWDPDVIEGHNLFGFDLPFLLTRARRHGIPLSLGRDGSELRQAPERNYAIGGTSRPFTPAYAHGRHVIDTYLVVQRFDWAKGALSSYGLKECARQFGFAHEGRIELPRDQMPRLYREETERVREYARQDAIETRMLADLITPVEFYQTQMVPDNYGQVTVTGNGEKINSIFIRAYLAAGRAVPQQQQSRPYPGGYTEVRLTGVQDEVVKADVESLYPNLMLTQRIAPASDSLGVFLPCLRELTERRLESKRRAQEPHPQCVEIGEREEADSRQSGNSESKIEDPQLYWDGLQGSFKVLINSFYGYLGGPFHWNDYAAAQRVTELGRELVQEIARDLEATGSRVIEIDTDGVYFTPPPAVAGEEAARRYVAQIGAKLPEGIRLAFDGRFKRMLSLKTKNYVLETPDGRRIFKGASLRSRADERYGRRFLARAIDRLLESDPESAARLYEQTIADILDRRVPIEDLVRRERVTEKTFHSEQKRRSAAVAEGVQIGEYVYVYERADGSLGLEREYAQDENQRYYMEKLYKFAKRLEEGFEGRFDELIRKPTAQGIPHIQQTTLDLFS